MFTGKEWGTVLRFWADNLSVAYQNYVTGEGDARGKRLSKTTGATIRGASVVMTVSLIERLVLDCLNTALPSPASQVRLTDVGWHGQLGVDGTWDGWDLLRGVVALRHCFAHEYGRVTTRQRQPLADCLVELCAGNVYITMLNQGPNGEDETMPIEPFYDIDANDTLSLDQKHTSRALRFLGIGLLRQLEAAGHLTL